MTTDPYTWACGCGEEGIGETAAQRHAKTCGLLGYPATLTTCRITVWREFERGRNRTPCGEPTVDGRLCAKHRADRERLT